MRRLLAWVLILATSITGLQAWAQTLRLRSDAPTLSSESGPRWPAFFRYSVATDYADSTAPRGYVHSFLASLGYRFDDHWLFNAELGARAETVNGQIDKEPEQSHAEKLSPSTALELDYENRLFGHHSYSFFVHGEPLWDEASRLEGYKGLVGAGGGLVLNFFSKVYSISQSVDATSLINTYPTGSDLSANPDYFYTYRLSNAIHFWGSFKLAYTFGVKVTRYMDNFWGYNYQNTISLSKSWQKVTVAVAYDNGGFTDDGQVSLWYLDQYRRIGRLTLNYAF